MNDKMKYVVGLAFNEDMTELQLIEKKRPKWQEGLLNGVGGKIEATDASPRDAMVREFQEETGVEIQDWREVASHDCNEFIVTFFTTSTNDIYNCQSITDERLQLVEVRLVSEYVGILAPNLDWLVSLCFASDVKPFSFSMIHDFYNNRAGE